MTGPTDPELEAEAWLLGWYIVGESPSPEVVARYREAVRTLWPESDGSAADRSMLAFVRRRPWSLGPLDAASALFDRGGALRSRVLVASAILETTPAHADRFLPRTVSGPALLARLVVAGIASALLVAVGAALWPAARRTNA